MENVELRNLINKIIKVTEDMNVEYEENTTLGYLSIGEYFFEYSAYESLKEDYKNSCVYGYVTLEQYVKYVYCSW